MRPRVLLPFSFVSLSISSLCLCVSVVKTAMWPAFEQALTRHQELEVMLGDNEAAARSLSLAYAQRDPYFPADDLWLLPEDWPDHPGIRAALDKPELKGLFDMRRNYFKAQKMRGFK